MIGAVRRGGAHFSVTVPVNSSVRAVITRIPQDAWTAIEYPQAIWDDQLRRWVSDAGVAEIQYAAFTSRKKNEQVTARMIVRRVRARNDKAAEGQDELFPVWRCHAVFTDSPFEIIQAEGQHRDHAIVEQVIADLNDGILASRTLARARTATVRRDIIAVAARAARCCGGLTSPDSVRTLTPETAPRPQTPAQEPPDTPQNRQRQHKHARKQIVEARADNRRTRHSTGGSRLRPR